MKGSPWKSILLGCLITLIAAAAASALFVDRQVRNIRDAINQTAPVKVKPGLLAPAGWGDAQTLLLVGNDQRNSSDGFKDYGSVVLPHSNEMLLVRIDPSEPWISMLSIPRELWVPIDTPQGVVTNRFNYSYTAGGVPLLVSTIKQILGLSVNHVIVINFNQFQKAVDDLGCIYSSVDRRYYHVNTPYSEQYFEINLQPGYQRMCGQEAVQFVSYRHGDTSQVRDARDQDFLLDARKQLSPELLSNLGEFESIFGRTVQTDPGLHSTSGILDLMGTVISSAGKPVRQVQFQDGDCTTTCPAGNLTATSQQIEASVTSFMYGANHVPKKLVAEAARRVRHPTPRKGLALTATPVSELVAAKAQATHLPFPLEFPRVIDSLGGPGEVDLASCPQDALQVTCMRRYLIHGPGHAVYPAYVIVEFAGLLGQNYDVQGTTWTSAPLFRSPDQTIRVGPRTYYLYYQGAHVRTLAWFEHGAVYWIHNTLLDSVGNSEMLAIAEQTAPVDKTVTVATATAARLHLRLHGAPVPARLVKTAAATTSERLGWLAGIAVLLGVPLMCVAIFRRRRELRHVKADLRELNERGDALLTQLDRLSGPRKPRQGEPAEEWSDARYYRGVRRVPQSGEPAQTPVGAPR